MDRERITDLLEELDAELGRVGTYADLFIVGGAAMAIAYDARRATRDIDAVFEPKTRVYEAVEAITKRHADLDEGWLNDAVKGLMLGPDPSATVISQSDNLTVSVASPGYLFAMKAAAARVERDADDLTFLYRLNGFRSADQALEFIAQTVPELRLLPRTQYLIEDIAEAAAQSGN